MKRLSVSVALIVLGLASTAAGLNQGAERTPSAGGGIIAGIVVNERQEPVVRAQVQAFSVRTLDPQLRQQQTAPFSVRPSGSASTDAKGRFQISGLELGVYLVAAEAVPWLNSDASSQASIYAATFYPSTIDRQVAVHVSARAEGGNPIRLELVRVKGARLAGSVVSRSGGPASGMDVRLFHRFGGFGSESSVAVVSAKGTSGASIAAKWPPRSNCDQCTMLLVRSASLRMERKFLGKTATPVGVEFLTWRYPVPPFASS